MGVRAVLIGVMVMTALGAVAQDAGCAGVDLVVGSSRPKVTGVVEWQAMASSRMPWGDSLAIVTRVWGRVTVERWGTGDDLGPCLTPSDVPTYQAVGEGLVLVPKGETLGPLELAALEARFGPPVVYEPSAVDRVMAWLRVYPYVVLVVAGVGWAAGASVRRRRRSDPYLF